MSSLDADQIAKLLKEEASSPTTIRTRTKANLTQDRLLNTWFKLNHHICDYTCGHRVDTNNPTYDPNAVDKKVGNACWNINCADKTRNKESDRGTQIVVLIKDQYICRYCFLTGYLK